MKIVIILVLVVISILTPTLSFGADTNLDFGTRLIPSKLVAGKEGVIQVFAKTGGNFLPEKITGLTVTSLDSSILHVISVKDSETGFISEVTVKGVKPGDTKLFLAAPGFSSQELPVTVFGTLHNQQQLVVKVVPDNFSFDGPFQGFVSVELADQDGFPVTATDDVNVSLNAANNNILEFSENTLVIKKGEYFASTNFSIKESGKTGKTNIFATAKEMEGKSNVITIEQEDNQQVKLYLLQKKINVFGQQGGQVGHIIAQLQNENDEPVIANHDITVKYIVTNDIFANQNTSPNAKIGQSTGTFIIKKGTYWGQATFPLLGPVSDTTDSATSTKRVSGKYTVSISTSEPLSFEADTLEAVFYAQPNPNLGTPSSASTTSKTFTPPNDGDRFVKFEGIPIFATGNNELLGLVYLEDENDFPIIANKDIRITLDSTDSDFLSIDPVVIKKGTGSALVFGNVGHSIPEDDTFEINTVAEVKDKKSSLFETEVFGPDEKSLKLVAKPLIDKVLTNTEFPIVVYLTDNNNKVTNFPQNSDLFVSPSQIFEVNTKPVVRGDEAIKLNARSLDRGIEKLQFTVNDVPDAELSLESLSIKPANIVIDHSEQIFTKTNDIFSIQLLNSNNMPVFATEDMEIKLIVDDESLIQIPNTVTVKKGEYYTIFDAGPKNTGTTKITALSEGLPLSTTEVKISSLAPNLLLDVPDIIESGEVFTAKIAAKQGEIPLKGLGVKWEVDGGTLQLSDSKTGATGEALASIMSTSGNSVNIKASVSGSYYPASTIAKIVRVNATSEFLAYADSEQKFTKPDIGGIDPVLIIVPTMIVLMGYMLMKKGAIKIRNPVIPKQVQLSQ